MLTTILYFAPIAITFVALMVLGISNFERLKKFRNWYFAYPVTVCKEVGYDGKEKNTPLMENDGLYSLYLTVMGTAFVYMFPALIGIFLVPQYFWIHVGIAIGCLVIFSTTFFLWDYLFERLARDILGARQFLGPNTYRSNGWVFHPKSTRRIWVPHKSWLTKLTRFPATLRPVETSKTLDGKHALTTQLRQDPLDEKKARSDKDSDEQLFWVKANYQLALGKTPETIFRAYNRQFSRAPEENLHDAMERGMQAVDEKVLMMITGFADEILQQFRIDQFLVNIGIANENLLNGMTVQDEGGGERKIPGMKERLLIIGVDLVSIAVEEVHDVVATGGYKSERTRYRRAENASIADQRAANADREARVAEWQSEQAILVEQKGALMQGLKNRRIIEKTELQKFTLYMEMLAKKETWGRAVLQSYLAMSPDQQISLVQTFSDAAKAAGLDIGGSLVVVGGEGMNSTHRPTSAGTLLAVLREAFAMFGVKLPAETPAVGPTPTAAV